MIGKTFTAKIKPAFEGSANPPKTKLIPSLPYAITFDTPFAVACNASRPYGTYKIRAANPIWIAKAPNTVRKLIALRLFENNTAMTSNTTMPKMLPKIPIFFP